MDSDAHRFIGPMSNDHPRPTIEARGLSKHYGPFVAVHAVSFAIPQGRIVALVGPNGAGKTTIMRMLTGYLSPSRGTASILGFDVQHARLAAAAAIGYLPENGPLYLDMTPIEVLRFFGQARGLSRERLRERLDTVAEQCAIQSILDKPIGKLSKGLRQRVGLAQALLHDPAVLIMDEPTAGLDPIQIRQFRDHVRQLAHHKTLLVSTHILQEVDAIADWVLVVHRGRLVFNGTIDAMRAGSIEEHFYELVGDAGERTGSGAVHVDRVSGTGGGS
jgi:ABC-2 type transport system ATP-binding protein